MAGVSVILWGLGASLGFPLTISAASDTGPDAPTRVSVVATTGYLAFWLDHRCWATGEHYGLRSAMLVVLALVLVAAIVAKAVAKPISKHHCDGEQLMRIKLIAVDMDGTFLSDQKPIIVSALWRNTVR